MDVVGKHHPPEPHSRATKNYPQFPGAAQVVRLPRSTMGQLQGKKRDRDSDRATSQRPSDLLGLWPASLWLRPSCRASFRVRAVVADRGYLRLRDASGRLPDMWRESRKSSLVRWQEPANDDLPLVFGWLGPATLLEGRRRGIRYHMAECVPLGKTCRFVGFGPSEAGGHRVDWRRRSAVAEGAQVSHVSLPNRQRLEAPVMDWQGSNREDLPAILPDARQRTFQEAEVRLQRHVEGVLEGDRQKSQPGDPCARSIPYYAEDEQSNRRGSSGRGKANEGRWLRADSQTFPLVSLETAGELDREADGQAFGVIEIQPAFGTGSLASGRLSEVLGVRESRLGWEVPRPVVYSNDAFAA